MDLSAHFHFVPKKCPFDSQLVRLKADRARDVTRLLRVRVRHGGRRGEVAGDSGPQARYDISQLNNGSVY